MSSQAILEQCFELWGVDTISRWIKLTVISPSLSGEFSLGAWGKAGSLSKWLTLIPPIWNPFPSANRRRIALFFRFQYKGFYPALDEASRLNPTLRGRLEQFVSQIDCATCEGSRLRDDSAAVRFRDLTIGDLVQFPLERLFRVVKGWKLDRREKKIAGELVREIQSRVSFLLDVGLGYLTLHRGAASLSGGEAQRIRLAAQLGSGLCGVLYVLDEPTIGLHPRDNDRLIGAMHRLRDLGNTLLVVEHDHDVIKNSDYICDFGPRAGRLGGRIVAEGPPGQISPMEESVTGGYIDGSQSIPIPKQRRPVFASSGSEMVDFLRIRGARENNLKNIDLDLPLGVFTAITGPSGSGKSSLIEKILYPALARRLHRSRVQIGRHDSIEGLRYLNKVIQVDQSPSATAPQVIQPRTPVYLTIYDRLSRRLQMLRNADSQRGTSASTSRRGDATPVRERVNSKLKCIFCQMSG